MNIRKHKGEIIFLFVLLFVLSLLITQFVMAIRNAEPASRNEKSIGTRTYR